MNIHSALVWTTVGGGCQGISRGSEPLLRRAKGQNHPGLQHLITQYTMRNGFLDTAVGGWKALAQIPGPPLDKSLQLLGLGILSSKIKTLFATLYFMKIKKDPKDRAACIGPGTE